MKVLRGVKNMNIFKYAAGFSGSRLGNRSLVCLLSLALCFVAWPPKLAASQDAPAPAPAAQLPPNTQQTPEQLQQLVAPIALYPDSLVAQILAASTFPEQVVEADRWVQAHPDLKGADSVSYTHLGCDCTQRSASTICSGNVDAARICATSESGYSAIGATNCRNCSGCCCA